MLLSRLVACTARDCTCREVGLQAIALDVGDDFDPTSLTTEALRPRLASASAMNAQLDIDLGSVAPDDFEGRVPLSDDWAAYVESQIDGDLLDRLHEQWLRAKGVKAAPTTDWESYTPGDLVGWTEAHPDDRADLYADGDKLFIAEELYCVTPGCTCSEAAIRFTPTSDGAPPLGTIRLRIPTLEFVERDVTPDKATLLDRLWGGFCARHRHLAERLAERRTQMAELGSRRAQPRTPVTRSAERVGRNEPCPCGSGKKYKRCCALKSTSSG
jgi:hypothetical protein